MIPKIGSLDAKIDIKKYCEYTRKIEGFVQFLKRAYRYEIWRDKNDVNMRDCSPTQYRATHKFFKINFGCYMLLGLINTYKKLRNLRDTIVNAEMDVKIWCEFTILLLIQYGGPQKNLRIKFWVLRIPYL